MCVSLAAYVWVSLDFCPVSFSVNNYKTIRPPDLNLKNILGPIARTRGCLLLLLLLMPMMMMMLLPLNDDFLRYFCVLTHFLGLYPFFWTLSWLLFETKKKITTKICGLSFLLRFVLTFSYWTKTTFGLWLGLRRLACGGQVPCFCSMFRNVWVWVRASECVCVFVAWSKEELHKQHQQIQQNVYGLILLLFSLFYFLCLLIRA